MGKHLQNKQVSKHSLLLIDGYGYVFRAYYSLPKLTRAADGLPVGAIQGFANMLWKQLQESGNKFTHIAVALDSKGKTFRHDIYPSYKQHRKPIDEDLLQQLAYVKSTAEAFGIHVLEQKNFEADDLIASISELATKKQMEVVIASSDKDLMQLVSDNIVLLDPKSNKIISRDDVYKKFGVFPESVVDVQGLAGDTTDNIPGIPKIGIKIASELIQQYGCMEEVLKQSDKIKQQKRRENIQNFAQQAIVSKKLATLSKDVYNNFDFESILFKEINPEVINNFTISMGFKSLNARVRKTLGDEKFTNLSDFIESRNNEKAENVENTVFTSKEGDDIFVIDDSLEANWGEYYNELVAGKREIFDLEVSENCRRFIQEVLDKGKISIFVAPRKKESLDVGKFLGFATTAGLCGYIKVANIPNLKDSVEFNQLIDLIADRAILKTLFNAKNVIRLLGELDILIKGYDDCLLMAFALGGGQGFKTDFESLLYSYLGTVYATDKKFVEDEESQDNSFFLHHTIAIKALQQLHLFELLIRQLYHQGLYSTYYYLLRDLPWCIADMENNGVLVDQDRLPQLSALFRSKRDELEQSIFKLCGRNFNIGSPQQLAEVLFDDLSYPSIRKTGKGARSTKSEVLERLSNMGHEIPDLILQWRHFSKLISTYTTVLPNYISKVDKKIHSVFSLASTTTGRLSSAYPNLQNIPIKTEDSRQIREVFTVAKGFKLISADYSQIELRLLAHIGNVEELKTAYKLKEDIHKVVAARMFGVSIDKISEDMRRKAKTINYSIIYGISDFGLANQLTISIGEAREYMKSYFERFPGIKHYMDETTKQVEEQEFVETIFNRRINYKGISTTKGNTKAALIRAAINARIQGSQFDIIGRAMVRILQKIVPKFEGLKMVLQIHDELLFECPIDFVSDVSALIEQAMMEATLPALSLSVPLEVNIGCADNWRGAHS